ncbi:MAG: tRNA lysidine(34) synthetase TilS [Pseudorhodoplanes sp.]|uniref:tRNA lysidine(34) synthetase TilS n=1 Tax=Pseudorhodoplanes sp. TaxID=1934341 RepID=UPI003D0D622A
MPAAERPVTLAEARKLFAPFADQPAIVIAVSGGPDSTALLWLASRWRDGLEDPPRLVAVTVDHGLREESAREARAVATLARKLKVEHRTVHWRGAKPKTGIQEAARNERYRLLAEVARDVRAAIVMTAHTLDDQAETVLFRLLRGSGPSGLRGMAAGSLLAHGRTKITLFRPLLSIAKSRLAATLAAAAIPFSEDPSNLDPRFARPRLRKLMPALAAEGLSTQRLALLAERMSRADRVIAEVLDAALRRLAPGPWPVRGPVAVDAIEFSGLSEEIALRLLASMIDWTGNEGPIELAKLEKLFAALSGPLSDAALAGTPPRPFRRTLAGAMISLTRTKLTVERAPARRLRSEKAAKRRIPALTTRKTGAIEEAGTR